MPENKKEQHKLALILFAMQDGKPTRHSKVSLQSRLKVLRETAYSEEQAKWCTSWLVWLEKH